MAEYVFQARNLITGKPGDALKQDQFVAVNQGVILAVGEGEGDRYINEATKVIQLEANDTVVPGFIDLHIHGTHGVDVMDASDKALETMAIHLPEEGTTSFLATTITQSPDAISDAIQAIADFSAKKKGAALAGVHVEGPFINEKRKGAQPAAFIGDPSIKQMQNWIDLSKGRIKQVTYAPERNEGIAFTAFLSERGITASIGHSDANYEQVNSAIQAGANQVTHLFNGMSPLHHREPGVAGAALLFDQLDVELIVDGIHIHPEIVRFAWKAKGTDRCLLITDSMRAKGLDEGEYDLGGQQVKVAAGKATLLETGSLAGSVLKMNDAVSNMIRFTGCSLAEAVQMATYNPAKKIGILEQTGTIEQGKHADLTVLRNEKEVILTYCKGEEVFRKD
ncbi:N-acetylglucosamine-6-phosphate deacetylase [Bacillus sp. JCM 19046]|nr:N-acetylglucosamine-6-phosphate deacetylase [Bacillus sp. JCM 19046]